MEGEFSPFGKYSCGLLIGSAGLDLRGEVFDLGHEVAAAFIGTDEATVEGLAALSGNHADAMEALDHGFQSGSRCSVSLERRADFAGRLLELAQRFGQSGQLCLVPGDGCLEPGSFRRCLLGARPDGPQLLCAEPQVKGLDLSLDRVVAQRGVGLPLQRPQPALLLVQDVGEARNVEFRLLETANRTIAPPPVFGDARSFLDHRTVLVGASIEDVTDLALADQDVLMPTDAAVAQELVEIHQATLRPVELVFRGPVPIETAGHRDLVEIDREEPVDVVERERDLGPADGRPGCRTGEDHVLHLLGSQRRGCLRPHDPGQRIEQIRLARTVGADHDIDPTVEIQAGAVGKRLEAGQRKGLEQQGSARLPGGITSV